jgi:hypothetical protein
MVIDSKTELCYISQEIEFLRTKQKIRRQELLESDGLLKLYNRKLRSLERKKKNLEGTMNRAVTGTKEVVL